jgi:hypothetical protein
MLKNVTYRFRLGRIHYNRISKNVFGYSRSIKLYSESTFSEFQSKSLACGRCFSFESTQNKLVYMRDKR